MAHRHTHSRNPDRSQNDSSPSAWTTSSSGTGSGSPVSVLVPSMSFVDEATQSWINHLRFIWGLWKKSAGVTQTLHEYYASAPNAYQSALFIMVNCGDFHQAKANSLSFTVMEEFCRWILPFKQDLERCLTREVKFQAFNTVTNQRQPQLVKMVIDTYEMAADKSIFLDPIKQFLANKQYKEACQSASHLGLQEQFSLEEIIIPLVFQDKLNVANDYLHGSKAHQLALVKYLDNLLGQHSVKNAAESVMVRLDIPDVKMDKLYSKPLSKLVARLVKSFNLSEDKCPNFTKKRREGALMFLVYKRYQDRSLSMESWREMVNEAVAADSQLNKELVIACVQHGDVEEGLYWAKKLGMPREEWPSLVTELDMTNSMSEGLKKAPEDPVEDWDDYYPNEHYHPFPLSIDKIVFVDSPETFHRLLVDIEAVSRKQGNDAIVAIDSEWKPHFGTKRSELSLIQIAFTSVIYIVDATYLTTEPTKMQSHWQHLAATLFNNEMILKLGFGLSNDLAMIRSCVPALSQINFKGGYLDFTLLWKRLVQDHEFRFPYQGGDGSAGESLSRMVELTLGHPLNKSEQFSNWERRPLRNCQKVYAALDAFCLIQIFNKLNQCCSEQSIPFREVCLDVINNTKMKKLTRQKSEKLPAARSGSSDEPDFPCPEPVRAGELQLVCDTMIQGLGRSLRKCGVDTLILENGQRVDTLYEIASRDKRAVVTKGKNYTEIVDCVPRGWCCQVRSDAVDEQLAEVVRHFNLIVTKEDVFSRCQECNSASLLPVSNATMNQLASAYRRVPKREAQTTFRRPRAATDLDWYSGSESEDEGHSAPTAHAPPSTAPPPEPVDLSRCATRFGVPILVNLVPDQVLKAVASFVVCEYCGKCTWQGRERMHFAESIRHLLAN